MAKPNPARRFGQAFGGTATDLLNAWEKIGAEAGALGAFGGSRMQLQMIAALHETTKRTLEACLADVGKMTDQSPRKRRLMLASVRAALDAYLVWAEAHTMERIDKIAPTRDAVRGSFMKSIAYGREQLRDQVDAFDEGWTAPLQKPWPERHPLMYASGVFLLGLIVSQVAGNLPWAMWVNGALHSLSK